MNNMTTRYRLIHRNACGGTYYAVDKLTGKRASLQTSDKAEAARQIAALNEAASQTALTLPRTPLKATCSTVPTEWPSGSLRAVRRLLQNIYDKN